jgi:flagellar biosynthesis chaperone FliJ
MPKTLSLVWAIILACPCYACEIDTISGPPILSSSLSSSALDHLNSQYTSLDKNISQQTASMLASMQSKEARLRACVAKKDSTRAGLLFDSAQATYRQWQKRLQSPMTAANAATLNEYIPRLDSMSNALKFLQGKSVAMPAGDL